MAEDRDLTEHGRGQMGNIAGGDAYNSTIVAFDHNSFV
jgi:hypothetical protein